MLTISILLSTLFILSPATDVDTLPLHRLQGKAQGTTYQLLYRKDGAPIPRANIDSILGSIDKSLSLYQPHSLISRFNQSEKGLVADEHLAAVVRQGLIIQSISGGVFDIRLYRLAQSWGFGPNPSKHRPTPAMYQSLLPSMADSLWFAGDTLRKDHQRVMIDLDGIAQGYTVDVLANYLKLQGAHHFMVELGGEIRTAGKKSTADNWRIGVESPSADSGNKASSLIVMPGDGAITTSGSYRRTRTFGDSVFSHVLDPRVGRPISNGMLSCTIIASSAMMADALDNVGMVLGPDDAASFFSRYKEVHFHLVWLDASGHTRSSSSAGFIKRVLGHEYQQPYTNPHHAP